MKHSPRTVGSARVADECSTAAASRETLIREQAYALYEARGKADGHAVEDWLEAELRVGRTDSQAAAANAAETAAPKAA
jgi:Protein of unknown function (DUF2934)